MTGKPAAAALLIGLGWLGFGALPGMPAAITLSENPKPWLFSSQLCVVTDLLGVGLPIDRPRQFAVWRITGTLLLIAMLLSIASVA